MTGRITQKFGKFGSIIQPVGKEFAGPVSVTLQSVEPWSKTQLWPPPVSGLDGSLCSKTEVSGTHTEPVVPVNTPGDQLFAFATGGCPITKPSAGRVEPSEQIAQA